MNKEFLKPPKPTNRADAYRRVWDAIILNNYHDLAILEEKPGEFKALAPPYYRLTFATFDPFNMPPERPAWDLVFLGDMLARVPNDLSTIEAIPQGMPIMAILPVWPGKFARNFLVYQDIITRYRDVEFKSVLLSAKWFIIHGIVR